MEIVSRFCKHFSYHLPEEEKDKRGVNDPYKLQPIRKVPNNGSLDFIIFITSYFFFLRDLEMKI